MRNLRVLSEFATTPWALRRDFLSVAASIVVRWASGEKLATGEIRAAVGDAPEAAAARRANSNVQRGAVAVIPIYGVLTHRTEMIDVSTPSQSTAALARDIKTAAADPAVSQIVLEIDSPGGSVYGTTELGDTIAAVAAEKPVTAMVNLQAASAAYWIASQSSEIVVSPSGEVGSIGVYAAHEDVSRFMEAKGITTTFVSAGKYKVEGNPFEPLGTEARAAIQARVDDFYSQFVRAVANGRKTTQTAVREGFGEGRMVDAQDAVKLGMADRIMTFDDLLAELTGKSSSASNRKAAARRVAAMSIR